MGLQNGGTLLENNNNNINLTTKNGTGENEEEGDDDDNGTFKYTESTEDSNKTKETTQSNDGSNQLINPLSKAIMMEGDFEFLRFLNLEELLARMSNLDHEMEAEIEELRRRYAAKRQPILDAMDTKKKRQQNF